MEDDSKLFNRNLYKMRRARFAHEWKYNNFLKLEAADRLADKLADVTRRFPLALDLGSHQGELAKAIAAKTDRVIQCDLVQAMQPDIICDEEYLPFAAETFDLVASVLSLHHVNDLPGCFIQIRNCLKADGMFVAVLPGANTLKELRESILAVSAEQNFPLAPRISPFLEVRDAGSLLQRAGFALPVVDSEIITVEYPSALKVMQDLHRMGESNLLLAQHKGFTSRAQIGAIAAYYEEHFRVEDYVSATFELVTVTGWKPHSAQQKPSKRGSGEVNLKLVI